MYRDTIHWQKNRFLGAVLWSSVLILFGGVLGVAFTSWVAAAIGGTLAAVGVLFLFMAINFRTLHVQVDDKQIQFSLGLFKKRVPLETIKILGTRSWRHERTLAPAWGIMPVSEGVDKYVAWGGTGDCVALVTTDGDRYLVSATDASRLLGAIGQAVQDLPASPLQVLNS